MPREKPYVRLYKDSDYENVLDVLERNFRRQDDFFAQVWTWQIEENPHRFDNDEPTRYVLTRPSDDKPVGFVANLPMRFLIEGELVRAVNPMHYSVDEEYRFHGVHFLYDILNCLDVFLTASAGAVSKLIFRKYGCGSIDMTKLIYKVVQSEFLHKVAWRLRRTRFRRLMSLILLLLHRVKMGFRHRMYRRSVHVWKVYRFDEIERYGPISFGDKNGLRVYKDVTYLNWRYVAFPMQPTKDEFHIWAGRLGDKTGYIVLNLRPGGHAMIYDLAYGSEVLLATTLIQTAVEWSIRHCRSEVLVPCLPEADRAIFENVGFEAAEDSMTHIIFYHRNKDIMAKMGDKSFWNVYFGDLEISHCM